MALQIEKNIPIPQPMSWMRHERIRVPWGEMEVGDSVFVPEELSSGIKANATQTGKRLGVKFTVRNVPFGVRVWRIE